MKISVTKTNGIHNLAKCQDCDWQACAHDGKTRSVSDAAANHVRKTGHTVIREVANSVKYSPSSL